MDHKSGHPTVHSNDLENETGPCIVRDYLELYKAEMSISPSKQRAHQSSTLTVCQECVACKTCRQKHAKPRPPPDNLPKPRNID